MKRFSYSVALLIIIAALIACGGSDTDAPTEASPIVQYWQDVKSVQGNGALTTESFAVGNAWRIRWSCNASLSVTAYKADSKQVMTPWSSDCGERTFFEAGTVYLEVKASGDWELTVQEFK